MGEPSSTTLRHDALAARDTSGAPARPPRLSERFRRAAPPRHPVTTAGVARLGGVRVGGEHRVVVMGVLNASPESFYPGSVRRERDELARAAQDMVRAGAALIDVGARSTAPYVASTIGEDEEGERLARAVEAVVEAVTVPVSADTARAGPAAAALDAGARVINDVSGLRDPRMGALVRERRASVILMASPEQPRPRAARPRRALDPRGDPVGSVRALLEQALARARAARIADEEIVLDPGIGFFRDEAVPWDEWDVTVLAGLSTLATLGRPLGVGVSRKSFLGAITGHPEPGQRLAGSLAATALAVLEGAAVIRTHDVAETVDAVLVVERVRRARTS